MSASVPSLDAIPLPGETAGDQKSEKKKSKLRRLQDSNQPSSILVTKVVTTKTSSHPHPASKLKTIDGKQKGLPVAPFPDLASVRNQSTSTVPNLANSQSSCSNPSSAGTKSLSLPPSQTIVDELFKDFLASKQKEEQSTLDQNDPDIVSSMEEMSKLLDEEISMINGNTISQNQRKKKGRWDCEEKKESVNVVEEKTKSERKKGRWDSESRKESEVKIGVEVVSHGAEVEKADADEAVNEGKDKVGGIKLEISKQSRDWINSGDMTDQKKKAVLEEGEVLSSSSDESDEESEDSEVVEDGLIETGSLSNSDKEGKSKSKKKKKHKHKHKKKKKHKSAKGERKNSKDKSSKEDRKEGKKDVKKEKSEEGKKKEDKKERKKEDKKDHKSKSSEKRRHSRSRSKSPKRRRTRSRTKSKERHRERTDDRDARSYGGLGHPRSDRHHRRSRSRSRSRDRSRSKSRERSKSRDRSHEKSRRRDRDERHHDREYRHRERERGGERDRIKDADREKDLRVKIDKSKLRKIAIANVLAAVKAGEQGADVDLATLKAGGKSVEELTDFCKKISEKGYSDSDSDSEYGRHSDGEEGEGPFINHPFKLRDPSTLPNIIMNIRNSKQLPVLTPQAKATQCAQLRLQFPVSSGSQHRAKEDQWVPVEKTTAPVTTTIATITPVVATTAAAAATVVTHTTAAQAVAQTAAVSVPLCVPQEDKVFPDPPAEPIDIGAIVSERLSLVRKLTENPYDVQALCSMHKAQEKSSQWAQSKFLPGQFTGSTGVQPLSQLELAGPDKKNQAWFKKVHPPWHAPVMAFGPGTDFAL
ncbi:protein Son-like isoform X2 [Haliotis rufescens]|uniref:protein Son-like isoform X2 n=1 Tax=Haliotis rufescens TaxID=6454 RepID=UPI00201FAFE6|nr:protein Son-like isoform X2 [Haliotis rufescens]